VSDYTFKKNMSDMAKIAGMSSSNFFKNFKATTGLSPLRYQKKIRLQEARLLFNPLPIMLRFLTKSNLNVKKIAEVYGEEDQSNAFAEFLSDHEFQTVVPRMGETLHV
jgi:AraC-like DNA-binding protein